MPEDPAELNGGAGTDESGSDTKLLEEDLLDRQERRAFRKEIFKWTGRLIIFLIFCWTFAGIITILGIIIGHLSLSLPGGTLHLEITSPPQASKYFLIAFGIVSSVFLAVFMAVIGLAKENRKKDEDHALLVEIGQHCKDFLLSIAKSRAGGSH